MDDVARGNAGLSEGASPQDELQQPPAHGAVANEPTDDPGQGEPQSADEAIKQTALEILSDIPEAQREGFAEKALDIARKTHESTGRIWQGRLTPRFQEVSKREREAEIAIARAEERTQTLQDSGGQGAAPPQGPQQDPYMAEYDRLIAEASERENPQELIQAMVNKGIYAGAGPAFRQLGQKVQYLANELAQVTQRGEQARLEKDALYQQHRQEIDQRHQEEGGRLTLTECKELVSAEYLRKENEVLRGGQRAEASAATAARAANVVAQPGTPGSGVIPPPPEAPQSVDEAFDRGLQEVPGEKMDMRSVMHGGAAGGAMGEPTSIPKSSMEATLERAIQQRATEK